MISGVGMVLTEGTLGLFCYFKHEQYDLSDITWIPIAALTTFIVFFNVGFGPLPWIIMAEMFSNKYKSFAIGFVATVAWVASFLVTKCFDVAVTSFGMDNVFFFCALCCFISIIFTTIYLIETKGKSLQEIQELLSK